MNLASVGERISGKLSSSIYDNPVVIREFRTRMRGWKAFTIMGGYVLLLAVVLLIAYYAMWEAYSYRSHGMGIGDNDLGLQLVMVLTWTQTILITLIVPSLTASTLTNEIEKKTMQMLALTRLSPGKIIVGKQLSGFVYSLVLLLCSAPLAGMCLMLGGISPAEIGVTYALLIAWAFLLNAIGVYSSSMSKRSANAILSSFGVSILYGMSSSSLGSMLVYRSFSHISHGDANPFCLLNPGWGPIGALDCAKVCGVTVPVALVAFVLHIAIGTLMLLVASTHVAYTRANRSLSIRLLMLGIIIFATWVGVGQPIMNFIKGDVLTAGVCYLLAGIVIAATFATGEIKKKTEGSIFSYAFSLHRAFTSDLGGAIGFVLLWTAVSYGTFGLTTLWNARVQHAAFDQGFWSSYFKVGISILAIVTGMCAVGVLASALVKLRKDASALVILFTIFAFSVYGVMLLNYDNGWFGSSNVEWHLAMFWPLTPIYAAAGEWSADMPHLPWINYAWLVCSLAYMGITAVALALAQGASRKFGGVREDME